MNKPNDKHIAVLDLETTGRYPEKGTIIEIGVCLLDIETNFKSVLLDTLVREQNFETKFEAPRLDQCWVFQNSTINIDMVRQAPTWEEVMPKIQKILNFFPVTAYNKAFDFSFLRSRGVRIPKELPCPMLAATPVMKIPKINPISDRDPYKWPSVQELWHYFNPSDTKYSETHRAYDDAAHEAELVHFLYKSNAWKPIQENQRF